jgi:hypothetical protein
MRKTITFTVALLLGCFQYGISQTSKGNILLGGDFANFDLGLQSATGFQMQIDPKIAIFFHNNFALGIYGNFDLQNVSKSTSIGYGAGILSRVYTGPKDEPGNIQRSRFFFELDAGIAGKHATNGNSTDGLGLGGGPGYTYFLSPNIGLETLVKYEGVIGFGKNTTQSDLNLNIGFQIYLDSHKLRKTITQDMNAGD